jgi:hypothetical protein
MEEERGWGALSKIHYTKTLWFKSHILVPSILLKTAALIYTSASLIL